MKRFRRWVILALILLVIIGLIAGYILINSKPDELSEKEKQAAVESILGRKANLNPNIKTGESTYLGKYSTFKYPARAKIYTYLDSSTKNNNSVLETFSFDLDNPRLVLNYSTVNNTSKYTDIHDIPSVKLRDDKSRGYKMSGIKSGNNVGVAYSKDGGGEEKWEKTGFFLVNDKIYTFAVLGNNTDDVSKQFNDIINTLLIK